MRMYTCTQTCISITIFTWYLGALFFAVLIKAGYTRILHFFSFPTETKLSQKRVATLKARAMNYKWKSSHRVYGAHFPGPLIRDKQYPGHIPFGGQKNWSDCVASRCLWPAECRPYRGYGVTRWKMQMWCAQVANKLRVKQAISSQNISGVNLAKNGSHSEELSSDKACKCQIEIDS